MTTLDDKLLGEKLHYYCSSSSGESEEEDEGENEPKLETTAPDPATNTAEWNGLSRNTGPKGVIEDWQKYKLLQCQRQEENEKQQLELCKKLAMNCKPDSELEDGESEQFLLEYRKRRMQEMISQYGNKNLTFGHVVDIKSPNDFLKMVDEEHETTTIVVHVYDNNNSACKKINDILVILAEQYRDVKFCKVLTSSAGLSLHFKISGTPAFLVYKNKQIIGNFIRITDEFGDEFSESDIENFFIENGMLNDKTSPVIVSEPNI